MNRGDIQSDLEERNCHPQIMFHGLGVEEVRWLREEKVITLIYIPSFRQISSEERSAVVLQNLHRAC